MFRPMENVNNVNGVSSDLNHSVSSPQPSTNLNGSSFMAKQLNALADNHDASFRGNNTNNTNSVPLNYSQGRRFGNQNFNDNNNRVNSNFNNQGSNVQGQQQQQKPELPPLAFESTAAQQSRGDNSNVTFDFKPTTTGKAFNLAGKIDSLVIPGDVMIHECLELTFNYTKQSSKSAFNLLTKTIDAAYTTCGNNKLSSLDEGVINYILVLNKVLAGLSLLILREIQHSGQNGFGGLREARDDEKSNNNVRVLTRNVRIGLISSYVLTYPHIFPDVSGLSMSNLTDYCFGNHSILGIQIWDTMRNFVRLYQNKRFRTDGGSRNVGNQLYM